MRLIDADELNEYIGREALDTREKIFALVDRMPTIEPRSHGEWIPMITIDDYGEEVLWYKCKNCGWIKPHDKMPFCENCGADMRKEGESE